MFWQGLKQATLVIVPALHPNSWPTDIIEGRLAPDHDACVILCGAWADWMERNAIWHGEAGCSIDQSIKWALDTAMDLRHAGKDKAVKPCTTAEIP
jgi:hypothetical protein